MVPQLMYHLEVIPMNYKSMLAIKAKAHISEKPFGLQPMK